MCCTLLNERLHSYKRYQFLISKYLNTQENNTLPKLITYHIYIFKIKVIRNNDLYEKTERLLS